MKKFLSFALFLFLTSFSLLVAMEGGQGIMPREGIPLRVVPVSVLPGQVDGGVPEMEGVVDPEESGGTVLTAENSSAPRLTHSETFPEVMRRIGEMQTVKGFREFSRYMFGARIEDSGAAQNSSRPVTGTLIIKTDFDWDNFPFEAILGRVKRRGGGKCLLSADSIRKVYREKVPVVLILRNNSDRRKVLHPSKLVSKEIDMRGFLRSLADNFGPIIGCYLLFLVWPNWFTGIVFYGCALLTGAFCILAPIDIHMFKDEIRNNSLVQEGVKKTLRVHANISNVEELALELGIPNISRLGPGEVKCFYNRLLGRNLASEYQRRKFAEEMLAKVIEVKFISGDMTRDVEAQTYLRAEDIV
jgi:hypothetical protein